MTKDEIVGTVSLSRMMGGTFTVTHIYNEDGSRVSLCIDLKEDDRTIWRYIVVDDIPSSPIYQRAEDVNMYHFLDDVDEAFNRAVAGDSELFADGELMEDNDA